MFFIRDLKPKLNKQCDSVCAKLFVQLFHFQIPFIVFSVPFFIIHAIKSLYCFDVDILELLVSISLVLSQLYISTSANFTFYLELENDRRPVETSFFFNVNV